MTVVGSLASIGAHGDENLADLLEVGLVEADGQHLRYLGRPFLRVRLVDVLCCVLDRGILVDGGFPLLRAIPGSVDADAFDIDQAGLLVKYVRTPTCKVCQDANANRQTSDLGGRKKWRACPSIRNQR